MRPFSGKNYEKNESKCQEGSTPCVICGKPIIEGKEAAWLEVVDGGSRFSLADENVDPEDGGYMGCFPIGKTCLKRHKKELKNCHMES